MFIIQNLFFTELMKINYNKNYYNLKDPNETQGIIYIFNQQYKKSKYSIMNYYIYSSLFVKKTVSVDMEMLFYLSQKMYWGFQKCANIWKKKHESTSISTDLMLVPLNTYKSSTVITLYEGRKPYPFHLSDLYNIIDEALTHCSHDYFLEIKKIKNPYTNLPFNLSNVYNIYLAFIHSTYAMPILFKGFIDCNCNDNKFIQIYEPIIREKCIDRHFKNITNYKCVKTIRQMLSDESVIPSHILDSITIDTGFPWESLVIHFKPFAKLYHKVIYGLNPYSKQINRTMLLKKLKLFKEENPYYGRKFVNPKPPVTSYYVFGLGNRNTYITTVKTHFNDMNKEKLKHITYRHIARTPVSRNSVVNDDTSSSEEEYENENIEIN